MTATRRKNLVLIGYRGSGKTSVGRRAAERLRFAFVDTDDEIVTEAGMSIADIFAAEGEPGFRRREARVIRRVLRQTGQVVSAGGGAVVRDDNVEHLRRCGIVIWLTAPPEVLWSRIERDAGTAANRPPLSANEGLDEVRAVLSHRKPRYRRAAHASVDASGDDVDRVVEAVLAAYESVGASPSPEE